MSFNPDDNFVRYFATGNIISPFVAVFGDWSDRSALVRGSLKNGVKLGQRPMIECEILANNKSTRSMFMYWHSIRDMLYAHKNPDLVFYYDTLLNNIRIKRQAIREKAHIIKKKQAIKNAKKLMLVEITAQNKSITKSNVFKKDEDVCNLIRDINKYKFEFEYKLVNEM